jgi:hypothetical protein
VGSRERAIGPDEDCYVDEPVERLKQPGADGSVFKSLPAVEDVRNMSETVS